MEEVKKMGYLAQLLRRLTEIGLLSWEKNGENAFIAKVGASEFSIEIAEKLLSVKEKSKRKEKHWILTITAGNHKEETVENYRTNKDGLPDNLLIYSAAEYAANNKPKTTMQGNLCVAICKEFHIKI